MNYQRGAAVVWVIVLLIILIAGAVFWFSTRSSPQPTTPSTTTTDEQAPQTTDTPQQPAEVDLMPTIVPDEIVPIQPAAGVDEPSNRTSASTQYLPSPSSQSVTVRNQNGQITATPDASGSWQFTFSGAFAQQQQGYVLNLGDGTQVALQCETPSANGNVCDQLAPVSHTYTQPGAYQVQLVETSVGAGNEQNSTLLSLTVPDSSDPSAPASDNAPPAATSSGDGSGGGNSNSGPSTNSGDGSSQGQIGCTFISPGGGCITLIH